MKLKLHVSALMFVLLPVASLWSQKANCSNIYVDVRKGTINKLKPTASIEKIVSVLPCFTGITREDEGYNCGGGVFFIDKDIYAYTGRDYWEIRANYKGTWSSKLLQLRPVDLQFRFGKPVREEKIPGYKVHFFNQKYGCIRVQFSVQTGLSEEIGIHYVPANEVELCY
ncbi:MAG: hypothetical protein RLZZ165_2130 [Bacteroidota bacterium]|jgi:hypothetical protein